jgi:hypothetical protein
VCCASATGATFIAEVAKRAQRCSRRPSATHLWVWLDVEGRADKLLCVVLVLEQAVVVKTVMHHWELLP